MGGAGLLAASFAGILCSLSWEVQSEPHCLLRLEACMYRALAALSNDHAHSDSIAGVLNKDRDKTTNA